MLIAAWIFYQDTARYSHRTMYYGSRTREKNDKSRAENTMETDSTADRPTVLMAHGHEETMAILAREANGEFQISVMEWGERKKCLWIFYVNYRSEEHTSELQSR